MPTETPAPETAGSRGVPRGTQRLGGAVIALLSGSFVAWGWYTAFIRRYFYRNAALIFPAFFVIGVAVMIIPGCREERIARGEDVSRLEEMRLITPRWWAVLALAFAASFANAYFIRGR